MLPCELYSNVVKRQRTFEWAEPTPFRHRGENKSGLELLQLAITGEFPPPPMAMLMDIRLTEVTKGRAVFTGTPQEFHYNPLGTVHGGFAATLLDSALGCAVHTTLKPGLAYTTVELKVNYVRPMFAKTGLVTCEGRTISVGSRIATSEARLTGADGRLYAHGTATCLIFPIAGERA